MFFNSLEFLFLYLPVTFFVYFGLCRFKLVSAARLWLVFASLFFYAWWNPRDIPVILFSMTVNFAIGHGLGSPAVTAFHKRLVLFAGVTFNLILLGYFKYADFFIINLNAWLGFDLTPPHIELPLGISFFTFTQIAYLVDVHRGITRRSKWSQYFLFVTFFPHLLAGPIIHNQAVMPQFDKLKNFLLRYDKLFQGLVYLSVGMFQKVLIADYVGPIAQNGFINAPLLTGLEAWAVLFAYALQIYFDFAGYSNMAIGLAKIFNIDFPVNFNSPYQAVSIIDFWRRWHITLSQFLRDYLYIPLGGNRLGEARRYLNVFLTMFLGGLWHGAGWTFIAWGSYHGILIVLNHALDRLRFRLPRIIAMPVTVVLICFGWVFFRSANMEEALQMFQGLLGAHGFRFRDLPFVWGSDFFCIAALCAFAMFFPNLEFWIKKIKPTPVWFAFLFTLLIINILFLNRDSAFLYFQF